MRLNVEDRIALDWWLVTRVTSELPLSGHNPESLASCLQYDVNAFDSTMAGISQISARVRLAIRRTRLGVLLMGCAYAIGLIVGIVSVHRGHQPTLALRDRIVSKTQASSPILHYSSEGHPIVAAGLDCVGNLMGATATAAAGWWALPLSPLQSTALDRWHRFCGQQPPKPI
jgi:hypothetical protein